MDHLNNPFSLAQADDRITPEDAERLVMAYAKTLDEIRNRLRSAGYVHVRNAADAAINAVTDLALEIRRGRRT